jgi:hypothetical protein
VIVVAVLLDSEEAGSTGIFGWSSRVWRFSSLYSCNYISSCASRHSPTVWKRATEQGKSWATTVFPIPLKVQDPPALAEGVIWDSDHAAVAFVRVSVQTADFTEAGGGRPVSMRMVTS